MTKSSPETLSLARLIQDGTGGDRVVATRDYVLPLHGFARGTSLGHLSRLEGRSVVLSVRDMAKAVAALIDLDGCARRILLCPPGWETWRLEAAARDADADALVYDDEDPGAARRIRIEFAAPSRLPLRPLVSPRATSRVTEWILPTSGTSGPPKLVAHTLRTLMGAIADAPLQQWATFYDIRRYGGLQIFLRAISGQGSLILGGEGESISSLLSRFGAANITHISGTPSHWRKVLMSGDGRQIDPKYVRLSGEIADDAVLGALHKLYPCARIEHAYASTEAGVAFAVDDGKAGFPASWLRCVRSQPVCLASPSTLRTRIEYSRMAWLSTCLLLLEWISFLVGSKEALVRHPLLTRGRRPQYGPLGIPHLLRPGSLPSLRTVKSKGSADRPSGRGRHYVGSRIDCLPDSGNLDCDAALRGATRETRYASACPNY